MLKNFKFKCNVTGKVACSNISRAESFVLKTQFHICSLQHDILAQAKKKTWVAHRSHSASRKLVSFVSARFKICLFQKVFFCNIMSFLLLNNTIILCVTHKNIFAVFVGIPQNCFFATDQNSLLRNSLFISFPH